MNAKRGRYPPKLVRLSSLTATFLVLSMLLGASGVALASPRDPNESTAQLSGESSLILVFGSMTVEMVEQEDGLIATFRQSGVTHRVSLVTDSDGTSFSIDGGARKGVPRDLSVASRFAEKTGSPIDRQEVPNDPFSTRYWWDWVLFIRGYPNAYPHPDRSFYQIYTKPDWRFWGAQLLHFQIGADKVGSLVNLGPAAIGIAIGAIVGWIAGGPIGSAIGGLVGAIVAGLLSYYYHVAFVDESGTIWWWANKGLFNAIRNIPWWLWICMHCVESYIYRHIDFLRVGTLTVNNELGLWGP